MNYMQKQLTLAFFGVTLLLLSACCPTTKDTSNMTLAQKCAATPSCKAALDKLGKDVQ